MGACTAPRCRAPPTIPAKARSPGSKRCWAEWPIAGDLHHTHSSTIATNALIERIGAPLGMLVTEGFRDLLELQRLAIPHPMRFDSRRPLPLVPRRWVRECRGRLDVNGRETTPLDEAGVLAAADELVGDGVEGLVVVFLHSYRNPEHERRAAELIRRRHPKLRLDISSETWPQAREFERGVLTTVNAFVRPTVERYLDRLLIGLSDLRIESEPRVARSNGGMERASTLRRRPVAALLSGPAAGVSGAAAAAAAEAWRDADLITLDMGGTSTDIGAVRHGRPVLSSEEHVAELPVLIPTVAVSSIGAGGGSVVWIDPSGALKLGPRSMGASPGPACYGRGSTTPTLTDAFLLAGHLDPERALAGRVTLDHERAQAAFEPLVRALGSEVPLAADGAIQIAVAMMAAEAGNVLTRRGIDAPMFRMVAYGGAGPLVGALLAESLAISTVLVPPLPGALSALGAATADLEGDHVEPVYTVLDRIPPGGIRQELKSLDARVAAWLADERAGLPPCQAEVRLAADMRYEGQGYDVTVPLERRWLSEEDHDAIANAFHRAHAEVYGHANERSGVWLKELRAHIRGTFERAAPLRARRVETPRAAGERAIWLQGSVLGARVFDRASLAAGERVEGPALIEQMDTTCLVPAGWEASVTGAGSLILEGGRR